VRGALGAGSETVSCRPGPYYVYALCEPDEEQAIRYVGRSWDPEMRLMSHLDDARLGYATDALQAWLAPLIAAGRGPLLRVLAEACDRTESDRMERAWIADLRRQGYSLLNSMHNAPDETWIQVRIPRRARKELESLIGQEGPSISWVARRMILDALAVRAQAAATRRATREEGA